MNEFQGFKGIKNGIEKAGMAFNPTANQRKFLQKLLKLYGDFQPRTGMIYMFKSKLGGDYRLVTCQIEPIPAKDMLNTFICSVDSARILLADVLKYDLLYKDFQFNAK